MLIDSTAEIRLQIVIASTSSKTITTAEINLKNRLPVLLDFKRETADCHLDQVGGGVGKVQEGFCGQRGRQVWMVIYSCTPKTPILEVVHFYRQLSISPCLRGPEFLNTADEAVQDIPR